MIVIGEEFEKRTYVRDNHGRFAQTAAGMVAHGREIAIDRESLPGLLDAMADRKDHPNLTLVDVKGTSLFNRGGKHAREDMPQVPSHRKGEFVGAMKDRGVGVTRVDVNPLSLKPSQGEISGRSVGDIVRRESSGKPRLTGDEARIIVSSDGYVLDGHHRWGAFAAMSIGGEARSIPAYRMDLPKAKALDAIRAWNDEADVKALSLGERARKALLLKEFQVFKHLPGKHDQQKHGGGGGASGDLLRTTPTGEPLPEGWGRLSEEQVRERRRAVLIEDGLHPDDAEWIANRGDPGHVYEGPGVTISVHAEAEADGLTLDKHGAVVRQAAFLSKAAPVENLSIRIDDRFVTHGAPGPKGTKMDRQTVGWTTMEHPDRAGHATMAIRPVAWTNRTPLREGLTVGTGGDYVMAHEWGHAVVQPKGWRREVTSSAEAAESREGALYRLYGDWPQVSGYAGSGPAEFYAEAFADWHQSSGKTTRPVVRKAAKEFGWFGSEDA